MVKEKNDRKNDKTCDKNCTLQYEKQPRDGKNNSKKQARQVRLEHTERCKATGQTNQKVESSVTTNPKHVQATSSHFIAQLCLLQKRQGAASMSAPRNHFPSLGKVPVLKYTTTDLIKSWKVITLILGTTISYKPLTVICHHCPACGCYWPLFKTTTLEVSHMEFNKNNPTVP